MSHPLRVQLTCLTVALLMAVTGCGGQTAASQTKTPEASATSQAADPTDEANRLMAEAKALAKKTYDLEGELWEGHMMMALIAPNAAAAKPELAKARALLDEMRANEKSIVALLDRVMRLEVSEELATYAGQQKEIAALRLLSMADVEDLLGRIDTLYEHKDKPSEADLEKLFVEIEPSDPDDPLAHLEEKGQASREYFRESGLPERCYINNGLGAAYDTPEGQTEEEAGAFPLADGIQFEGPMVAEEEGAPREIRGSFDTSLAEAMQAQRSTLESGGWSVSVRSSGETRGVMTARNSFWQARLTFEQAGGNAGTVVVRLTKL